MLVAGRPDGEPGEAESVRQSIYSDLATRGQGLLREIGEQLSAGSLRPYQLLTIPGYGEVISQGLDHLKAANEALEDESVKVELVRLAEQATRDRPERG